MSWIREQRKSEKEFYKNDTHHYYKQNNHFLN